MNFLLNFERKLESKSEIFYLFPALPSFVLFVASMFTAVIIFTNYSEFYDCSSANNELWEFLLGEMIAYYTYIIIYANVLLSVFPILKRISVTLLLMICTILFMIAWNIYGIYAISRSSCEDTVYYSLSAVLIALTFLLLLAKTGYFLYILIRPKKNAREPEKIIPENVHNMSKEEVFESVKNQQTGSPKPSLSKEDNMKEENID
ncbi:unnamed protein product [Blepharisma stoltei]|uniref:Uncharacterized protein n=1 Tax=Blepharisma stoltei TaxID=1481888 RepID=A0AAU9IEJ7_9CILI|nr:unnamed protein product [Blepharisma stoltei]